MNYKEVEGYFIGFADLTIGEVATNCADFFSGFSLLVTCLDSNPELRPYGESLLADKSTWAIRIMGESIWVDVRSVRDFLSDPNTLSHFDEVYLLREEPKLDFQVHEIFTTDRANFAESVPPAFFKMLQATSARRYLSDGSGLNFACEDRDLVRRLGEIEAMILRGSDGRIH
jgi:hypothetical protein